MEELEKNMVQAQIGYRFQNTDLLQQAFVRRSYAKEHGGADNEVLEFIGDKVLDIAVVRYLAENFGSVDESEEYAEYYNDFSEGKLTQLKAQMVGKNSLARRIDELGLAEFLILGNADIQNNVAEENSVKEDLFEAILGAVAIDSNWNFEKLQSIVEVMLDPDSFLEMEDDNYVSMIYEWESRKNGVIPLFWFKDQSYQASWYMGFQGIKQNVPLGGSYSNLKFTCDLKLLDDLPLFEGYGASKREARMNVCKLAYEWLDKQEMLWTIQDEIENPSREMAINQLEILARRGYFSLPTYEFEEEYDENGNPVWRVECFIDDKDQSYYAYASSKKEAKKEAAYGMLMDVLQ